MEAKAEEAMQQRVAAGIADDVEAMQPNDPPPFDQRLVGKKIEVYSRYINLGTEGRGAAYVQRPRCKPSCVDGACARFP